MNNNIAVKVENLSKKFKLQHPVPGVEGKLVFEFLALSGISFEIKKGESVGIFGANGSGKSTLLKILAGVTKPTTGTVEINGRVASILDIGTGVHPELSGRENIFLSGNIFGFSKNEIVKIYNKIVDFSGIADFIDEPVKTYSNGMYLRLAFSIMAHLDFDIYLFDEVMSVGDVEFSSKARNKMFSLREAGKTIIFVSHNINELDSLDFFILLELGEIKRQTRNKGILAEYIEFSIRKSNIVIHSKPIQILDFKDFQPSDDIRMLKLKLFQSEADNFSPFQTDKPFVIELEYEKRNDYNTVDVVISIADHQDNMILSSSPFISADFSEMTERGKVITKCLIPADFFNSQVYKISVFFLRNCKKQILDAEIEINPDKVYKDESLVTLKLPDIIVFKPMFFKGSKPIDLSSINLRGHLLAGFTWT